jgi:hypothetical protein
MEITDEKSAHTMNLELLDTTLPSPDQVARRVSLYRVLATRLLQVPVQPAAGTEEERDR